MAKIKPYPMAPYFTDSDAEFEKDYVGILGRAGKPPQSREFSMLTQNQRKSLLDMGDVLFSQGQIISGLQCTINAEKTKAIITKGKLYLDGLIRTVPEDVEVSIKGRDIEYIGAYITETLITEIEDPSLANPASGTASYNMAGAARIKQDVVFVVDGDKVTNLFKLQDGVVIQTLLDSGNDLMNTFNSVVARRTQNTDGTFKCYGLDLSTDLEHDPSEPPVIYIKDGLAYVNGWEINCTAIQKKYLNPCLETRKVNNEAKVYRTGSNIYFSNKPLSNITAITGEVTITLPVIKGRSGGSDSLAPFVPVLSVGDLYEESDPENPYKEGKDFELIDDAINWRLIGTGTAREPDEGDTYYVPMTYMATFIVGLDYDLVDDYDAPYIKFKPASGRIDQHPIVPDDGGIVYLTYNHCLYRADTIVMKQDGSIVAIEGTPDMLNSVLPPENLDPAALTLGSVIVYPKINKVAVKTTKVIRLTMNEVYSMYQRLQDLEYSVAVKDLRDSALVGEEPTELIGIFTDGFHDASKCDEGCPEFHCTIDNADQQVTVAFLEAYSEDVGISESDSHYSIQGRAVTSPFEEVVEISQPAATGYYLVNPYNVFTRICKMSVDPDTDYWVEDEYYSNIVVGGKTTTLRNWWMYTDASWAEEEKSKWVSVTGATSRTSGWSTGTTESGGYNYRVAGTTTTTSIIPYMRQKTLTIEGSLFNDSEILEFKFNNVVYDNENYTIIEGGPWEDKLKCTPEGKFKIEFTVPQNVPCGSVNINVNGNFGGTAQATYTARGTLNTTVTTINGSYRAPVPPPPPPSPPRQVQNSDPLAQTVTFEKRCVVTGVDLAFATKSDKEPVQVWIREMADDGYPSVYYYEGTLTTIYPNEVTTNSDKPVWTHITFASPFQVEANQSICICVGAGDNKWAVWTAEQNKTRVDDVKPGEIYVQGTDVATGGVLFDSANSITWSAVQNRDLTYRIHRAEYTGDGVVVWNDVPVDEVTEILPISVYGGSDQSAKNNNSITWEYCLDRATTEEVWYPVYLSDLNNLPNTGASTVSIKATFKCNDTSSPFILNSGKLDCVLRKPAGDTLSYVTRAIELPQTTHNLKVQCETDRNTLDTNGLHFYYRVGTGNENLAIKPWNDMANIEETKLVTDEWSQYQASVDSLSFTKCQFRVTAKGLNAFNIPRCRKFIAIMKD